MDILSFTTIILLLFIIIGVYLIFTNQIDGKPRILIVIAVLVCIIYIFYKLMIRKSTSPVDASVITNVPEIKTSLLIGTPVPLIDTTSPTFSLSTWIYITNWNPGVPKTVFSMTNDISDYTPKIILGPTYNELIITYYTGDAHNLETITIKEIRIQKWIHIVISFGEKSVDTYLDGKLVDSRISTGSVQNVTKIPLNTTLNWGGFIGNISSYIYKPTFLTPQEVLAKFQKGV